MLKLAIHIEAASRLQGVADADGGRSTEGHPYVDFIVLLQERTVNDTEDVLLMILRPTENADRDLRTHRIPVQA